MKIELSEQPFRMLFESVQDACFLIGNGRIIDCNQATVGFLGAASMDHILNRRLSDLSVRVQPDGRLSSEKADEMTSIAAREGCHGFEWMFKRLDGTELPADVRLAVMKSGERDVLCAILKDISGRNKADKTTHEANKLLDSIIDFLPYPTFIIDRDGTVLFWNKAMEQLTNVKAARIVGKGDYAYSAAFYGERRRILIDLVSEFDEKMKDKYQLVKRDTENDRLFAESPFIPYLRRCLDGCAAALRNEAGEVIGAIEIVRDITEEKNMMNELIQAREAAESAAKAKNEFLAVMSHEIRTPLNAILGMADLLWETDLGAEQKQYVNVFRAAGENLLGLINDILDISKVESGSLSLETADFDLNEVLERTCDIMAMRAHAKGLELAYRIMSDVPAYLTGDSSRLRQILINLIGNAIKFTEKGEVVVEVKKQEADDGQKAEKTLQFSVRDTGAGIPPDMLDAVFEKFRQVDSSATRKHGGTGLGLAISKRLVELMGGEIRVESRMGEGSTFLFTLKLGVQQNPGKDIRPRPSADIRGLKAIVVDDNATNRMILNGLLSKWGARVTVTEDGAGCLGELQRARDDGLPYDLLLLDYLMPGMDGFQVAEHIKNDPSLAGVTVLMLTSGNKSECAARARQMGIANCLIKPIKQSELREVIQYTLGKAKAAVEQGMGERRTAALPPLDILLVDDSPDNRLLIKAYFKKTPCKIDMAENGQEGVDRFVSGKYDLVLMDVEMPVMDGYTATRAIRSFEMEKGAKATPVMALTANAFKEDVRKSLDAGCTAHLTKPVKKPALFEAIRRIIGADSMDRKNKKNTVHVSAELKELMPRFLQNRRGDVKALLKALERGDYDTIRILGHSMKGTGAGYGFNVISDIGRSLEEAADTRKPGEIGEKIDELSVCLENTIIVFDAED